jgi:ATP-dependent Clp protease adaptor protein ClpS
MATDITVEEKIKTSLEEPKKWKVIVINDDHTPIDFVILMLVDIFKHDVESATHVTMQVHESGSGIAGVYNFEIAEVKAVEATKMARENGFPLQVKIESE